METPPKFDATQIQSLEVEGETESPTAASGLHLPRKEDIIEKEEKEEEKKEPLKEEEKKEEGTETEEETQEENKEEEKESDKDEPESVISQVKKSFDVEFKDNNGKDLEFTNDIDGVAKMAEFAAEKLADKRVNDIFDTYPEAYKLILHIQRGGKVEDFVNNQVPDFSTIKIEDTNEVQHKQIYTQYLKLRGNSEDEIDGLLEVAKTKGNLLEKAKTSLEALTNYSKEQKVSQEKEILAKRQQQATEDAKVEAEVKGIVTTGNILGLQLDKKTQNEFLDFLTKPVTKEGHSKAEVELSKLDLNKELYIRYLIFKDFKLGTNTSKVTQKLDELAVRNKAAVITGKEGKSDKNTNEPVAFNKVKFSDLNFGDN